MADAPSKDPSAPPPSQARSASESKATASLYESHGIEINYPATVADVRPHPIKHMSTPAYQSPIRHHRRAPSQTKAVKETLNARSHYGSGDDDGASVHRINQYTIKQEIGRGSFGAVHLAVDQFGKEYAIKEFSKSRLRKRAQSDLLRRPNQRQGHRHLAAGLGFNSPLHRQSSSDRMSQEQRSSAFELIKEEIAIMKKLNHNNVVSLIEVLDDPQEDSLYMVLEMCKKGVVMRVGIDDRAEPYSDEACRCWFRDMVLGIEYLHAQGIIHRDIKPDNCLITGEDVLKIVDFGVSEMFEKSSAMSINKSAGSPAFMPPELCVAKHGEVSGRAADIWSMGVTLYCLRYGRIPFEQSGVIELYESIRRDDAPLDEEQDEHFADLMRRLLQKDPDKRVTMEQLREHPWVTRNGTDLLLPADENCADLIEPPTDAEMNRAITGNMANLLVVMKAVRRFKDLLARKRPSLMEGILGRDSRIVAPPRSLHERREVSRPRSADPHDRRPVEQALVTEGVHRDIHVDDNLQKMPYQMDHVAVVAPQPSDQSSTNRPNTNPAEHRHPDRSQTFPVEDHAKGHAHNPLDDTLFLSIGPGVREDKQLLSDPGDDMHPVVSESPPAVELNIYEQAYQDEMKRIIDRHGKSATMFLNRRVEHRDDLRSHSNIVDRSREAVRSGVRKLGGGSGLAALVQKAKEQQHAEETETRNEGESQVTADPDK